MTDDRFLDEDLRVLTPEAFEFVLNNELKRAVRSQTFLTLLLVQPTPEHDAHDADRSHAVRHIARLISREVRETDLISRTQTDQLAIVLLDADLSNSMHVVDRLLARLKNYSFPTPVAIEVGAACCPTHGADPESLRAAAAVRPVQRGNRGNASNAQ